VYVSAYDPTTGSPPRKELPAEAETPGGTNYSVSIQSDRLTSFSLFLQNNLGPAPSLTDAQIGTIVIYVRDHFPQTEKKQPQSVALVG
jgi:hypothetical protein